MSHIVLADEKEAENEASAVHNRVALILGIGGLELPKLF